MITKELQTAIDHVGGFFPTLRYVIFTSNGQWRYVDEDLQPFNFDGKQIDVGILEVAADSIFDVPAIFDVNN